MHKILMAVMGVALAIQLVALTASFAGPWLRLPKSTDPGAITARSPGFECAVDPALFLTCHDGYMVEAIPTGEVSMVLKCTRIQGD